MPICQHCDKPLTCPDHGAQATQSLDLVQPCREKVAVWVEVKDDARKPVAKVGVTCAGATRETEPSGYAYFEDLGPGSHTAEITVPEAAPKLYKAPEKTSQTADVAKGQIKLFKFQLERYAFLKVKVVRADDETKFLPGIKVDAEEVKTAVKLEGKTTDDSKPVPFDSIEAGEYKVTLSFDTEEAKAKYKDLDTGWSQTVKVAKGATGEVVFKLTPVVRAYLTLKFTDPEKPTEDGETRFLPKGMPVRLVSEGDKKIDCVLGEEGKVLPKRDPKDKSNPEDKPYVEVERAWKWITLDFPTDKKNWVVCEKRGEAAKTSEFVPEDDPYGENTVLSTRLAEGHRVFRLPAGGKWNLKNADWKVKHGTADPDNYADHRFQSLDDESKKIGDKDKRVDCLLDCHWQYLQFEYYDRFHGEKKWSKKPVSVLPLMIEGYAKQQKDNDVPNKDELSTVCQWEFGKKDIELVQALPWILRRKDDDNSELKKPDKESTLRFQTDKSRRFLKSQDMTREYVPADKDKAWAPEGAIKPDVDRLRYYDMPEEWRSTCYFCRLSDDAADQDFFEMLAEKETKPDKPLIFSLDDMVLTDKDLKPVTLKYANPEPADNPNDRIAIFSHKFKGPDWSGGKAAPALLPKDKRETWIPPKPQVRTDRAQPELSPDGLYLHERAGDRCYVSAVLTPVNYIADYPNWTRLVIAQGNVHDVFDRRTPVKNRADKATPVGARAAVRWVEGAKPDYVPMQVPARPAVTCLPTGAADDEKFFAVQLLFEQRLFQRYQAIGGANTDGIGRCDPIFIRCCDRDDKTEIAQVIVYSRYCYEWTAAPAGGLTQAQFGNTQAKNVADRWNGRDGHSEKPEFLPKDTNVKLKVNAFFFLQVVPEAQSQMRFEIVDTAGRSWVAGSHGVGELHNADYQQTGAYGRPGGFVASHEWGHVTSQPDDYGETSGECSYDQLSFGHLLPGNPFNDDLSSMMNEAHDVRARNLWFLAEWARKVCGVEFKLKYGADEYWLPKHASAPGQTYASWPYSSAHAASTGGRSKFDVVVFGLGNDKTSNDILPALVGGGDRFDGIAVILVRMRWKFDFNNAPEMSQVLSVADSHIRAQLNKKFYATGKIAVGGEDQTFQRCMVVVQPRYIVKEPGDDVDPGDVGDYNNTYAQLVGGTGAPDFVIDIQEPTSPPTASGWTSASQYTIYADPWAGGWDATVRDEIYKAVRDMLGLDADAAKVKGGLQKVVAKALTGAMIRDV